MYVYEEFPKWKYSLAENVIVQDKAEEDALGDGWYNTPADLPPPKKGSK